MNRQIRLPSDLTVPTVEEMIRLGHRRDFGVGEFITLRGQSEPQFCVVISGTVRLTAFTEDGREMLGLLLRPGDCWGVHPCLGNFPETNDTLAESPVEVLVLSKGALDSLMWARIDFQRAMIQLLCNRLNLAVSVAEQLGSWTAKERLAWRLLVLAKGVDRTEKDDAHSHIHISQESLAAMLNLSRQHANFILKELEREGLILLGYGRISVLDANGLRKVFQRIH